MSVQSAVRVLNDPATLFQTAADGFRRCANSAVTTRGRFTAALSGGSTPKGLYSLLATDSSLPWDKIYFFFGDERHVPPDSPESNYRMASEALLSRIPAPANNVFRVPAEIPDADQAASTYEQTIRQFFKTAPGHFPRFDLILLGIGPDGHTASLFPKTKALQEKSRLFVANWVEKFQTNRLTLTLPVLNNAAEAMFLVSGQDKAPALHAVLESDEPGELYPAKLVQPTNGKLIWLVDRAAAGELAAKKS